jgi:hypothetical protein
MALFSLTPNIPSVASVSFSHPAFKLFTGFVMAICVEPQKNLIEQKEEGRKVFFVCY